MAGYLMSGFNTISNRWCFAYAFCICAILMFQISDFTELSKQELAFVCIFELFYFAFCYFVIGKNYYNKNVFIFLALATFLLISCWALEERGKKMVLPICLFLTCLSVYYSSFQMYQVNNNVVSFVKKGMPYNYYKESQYASFAQSKAARQDSTFYRVAGSSISNETLCSSFYWGINGITNYTSLQYPNYTQWLKEMELPWTYTMLRIYGLQNESSMLTLNNVKYYVLREGAGKTVPYGFQEIEQIQNGKNTDIILENDYALPIGYTYETYFDDSKYAELPVLGKKEVQLQSVVLKEHPKNSNIIEASMKMSAQQIPIEVTKMQGLCWNNGILKVNEAGASITLTFVGLPATETYLRVVNLDLTNNDSESHWSLIATTGITSASAHFAADAYLYAHGQKTQLLNLGYTESGYTTCTITFPSPGTFMLEDLEIWCQPVNNYANQINALREEVLENIETNWRGLTGTISVSKDKMLCIAIPYDEGWSAYVDGEKAKLYQANTAFMAVELSAGEHEIELRYWTPGLTAGITLSIIGAIGLIAIAVCCRKKKV